MKKIGLITIILLLLLSSISFADGTEGNITTNQALYNFHRTVQDYSNILIAFALSTAVLVFVIHFIRLANSYDHPFMRRQVQKDIFITGVTVALIGGIGLVGKIIAATALYQP